MHDLMIDVSEIIFQSIRYTNAGEKLRLFGNDLKALQGTEAVVNQIWLQSVTLAFRMWTEGRWPLKWSNSSIEITI